MPLKIDLVFNINQATYDNGRAIMTRNHCNFAPLLLVTSATGYATPVTYQTCA